MPELLEERPSVTPIGPSMDTPADEERKFNLRELPWIGVRYANGSVAHSASTRSCVKRT